MDCSTPGFPGLHQLPELLKLMSTESVTPSNRLILCRPLLLLPSIFHSIRAFSNESALHIRWQNYCSLSFSNYPSNEYSGLIYFRIHWFELLAVQGTLRSLLQTTVQKHQFFGAQLFLCPTLTSIRDYWENHNFDYMDLCRQSNVSRIAYACHKVILSVFVIAFLPRSKCL